jgi:sulfatase maturation enzyme AslB (radical SAM superfamily)
MNKTTARIIMFLDCNFHCPYCCNNKEKFNRFFEEVSFSNIDLSLYENVCLTGGEPFLHKDAFYRILDSIPETKNIFIYTNGVLITDDDVEKLKRIPNVKGLNIGIHGVGQLKEINKRVKELPVRYMAQDVNSKSLLETYPEILNERNTKFWTMDECYVDVEDWFLLID